VPVVTWMESERKYSGKRVFRGVAFLEGFLDKDKQLQLFNSVNDFYKSNGPIQHHGPVDKIMARKTHKGKYLLFFENKGEVIPKLMHSLASDAFVAAHEICDRIPKSFSASRINSRLYPLGSSLEAHMDNHDGWVVLFSLGCDAVFTLQVDGESDPQSVSMSSGSVIVFNGSTDARVLHSVDKIVPDSCPQFFPILQKARIGLQLRSDNVKAESSG